MHQVEHIQLDEQVAEYRGGLRAWFFWSIAVGFYLFEFFLRDSGSVLEKELQVHFLADAKTIGFVMASYLWVYSPMNLVAGVLFDKYGTKRVLPAATFLCGAGSIVFGLAGVVNHLWVLALGRILLGLGSAFAFVGTIYLASVWFSSSRMPLVVALSNTLGVLGGMLAQAPMAWLDRTFGWELTMCFMGMTGIGLALIMKLVIPERPQWYEDIFLPDDVSWSKFFTGLRSVLRNRKTWFLGIAGGFAWLPVSVFAALWGVRFLTRTLNISEVEAGYGIIWMYVGLMFGGPLFGFLIKRGLSLHTALPSAAFLGAIFQFIVIQFAPTLGVHGTFVMLALLGVVVAGQCLVFPLAVLLNEPFLKGTTIATVNFLVMILGAIAMPLIGALLDYFQGDSRHTIARVDVHALQQAMYILPISFLLAFILLLCVRAPRESLKSNQS